MFINRREQGRAWKHIKIENNVYMISVIKKTDAYDISLTNLIEVWIETLTKESILQRCQQLNPLLSVDALNYLDIVQNMLNDIPGHIVKSSVEEIILNATIENIRMKFAINLSKGNPTQFWETVMKPVCLASMELMRQHKFLLDLVQNKDEEIAEYKAGGAELLRSNIETKPFHADQLKTFFELPKTVDYANTFQSLVNFCNSLDVSHSSTELNPDTSSSTRSETETVCDTEKMISKAQTESQKSKSRKAGKRTPFMKRFASKLGTKNMICKPIKKSNNGLNGFIS